MIRLQASVSKAWLNRHGGFDFDERYYLDPRFRMKQDEQCHDFIKSRFPDYPLYNMEDNLVQAEYVVPGMMLIGAIQPNMIIAAALGARFVFSSDRDSDVSDSPIRNLKDITKLPDAEEILRLPLIRSLEVQYLEASEKYPECTVIPPFFWDTSGRATIHGIITTSLKFLGQDIFTKMMLEPEFVKEVHSWITGVYIGVVRHFSKLGNMPVTSLHVGECSGTMLDEKFYSEFVTPYISRLGRELGNIRLHSCGNADHIMSAVCGIDNLRVIDTGSNTSLAKIRQEMGNEFEINVCPPVEILTGNSRSENIQQWLIKTIEENNGGNLKIGYHLEPEYDLSACRYIHEELDRLGLVKKGRLY
jgi:hypothetical protein